MPIMGTMLQGQVWVRFSASVRVGVRVRVSVRVVSVRVRVTIRVNVAQDPRAPLASTVADVHHHRTRQGVKVAAMSGGGRNVSNQVCIAVGANIYIIYEKYT